MKKFLKCISAWILAVTLFEIFYIQGYTIRYTDGRFITNMQVHEFVKEVVEQHKDYKKISEECEIRFGRINFFFTFNRQANTVKKIELSVPAVNRGTAITFFVDLYSKKKLSSFEMTNLFLNSNEFNEQDFNFDVYNSIIVQKWCGDTLNKYDDRYSVATDITEENWFEKCFDSNIRWECAPHSLLFFEIHPGEKFFVEGYEE